MVNRVYRVSYFVIRNSTYILEKARWSIDIRNKGSRNKSSFLQYLPLFWPVWQWRAFTKAKLRQPIGQRLSNVRAQPEIYI